MMFHKCLNDVIKPWPKALCSLCVPNPGTQSEQEAYSTPTPEEPIHSDPAGKDTPTTVLEGLKAVLDSGHTISPNSLAHADIVAVLKPITPQTGRTYTEGERNKFAIDFLLFIKNTGYKPEKIINQEMWLRNYLEYLKLNPKP